MNKKNILALDMAEKTGVYSAAFHGVWRFPQTGKQPKAWGTDYKRESYFFNKVCDFIRTNGIELVVAEECEWFDRSICANKQLSFYHWGLILACQFCGIREPLFVKPNILKRFATGDYYATKEKMIDMARKRYRIEPTDDNEADAAHLYYYALYEIRNGRIK